MAAILFNASALQKNLVFIREFCRERDLRVLGVVKGCRSHPGVVQCFRDAGFDRLASAQCEDGPAWEGSPGGKPLLITLVPPSRAEQAVVWFSGSYNTEPATITRLAGAAAKAKTRHDVHIVVEVGDLREGVFPEQVPDVAGRVLSLGAPLRLAGLAVNFGCMSGALPSREALETLTGAARTIERRFGYRVETLSAGGSVLLDWLETNQAPESLTEIRVGEAALLGVIPVVDRPHPALSREVLLFQGEVLEVREKGVPDAGAARGKDAFGRTPPQARRGVRKRAVFDFGGLETSPPGLACLWPGVDLAGFNSNCSIFDVTDCPEEVLPGSLVPFRMNYRAMAAAFHAPFVRVEDVSRPLGSPFANAAE